MNILDKLHYTNKYHQDLIEQPLLVITGGNVVSYDYDRGIISQIVYKYKDFYYIFTVSNQKIYEDPKIQTMLNNLENPEEYSESWSR